MIINDFKRDTQNYRLLQGLIAGPVNTHQLLYSPEFRFGSHVRRMKDVKDYLQDQDFTIVKRSIGSKCFEYSIKKLEIKRSPLSELWEKVRRFFVVKQLRFE